jgi:glycosyltransferase involved in cell wall biosynthesis
MTLAHQKSRGAGDRAPATSRVIDETARPVTPVSATGGVARRTGLDAAPPAVAVEIVVPVHNEERTLRENIELLSSYLASDFPFPCRITIADNASTDATWRIAGQLVEELPGVGALRLEEKGRGRALRASWSASTAEVVAYMDVDLSTGLEALLPLVAPLLSGHSDVAIGTRLSGGSRVVRGLKREVLSRSYNFLVHLFLRGRFSDAQCGFKAVRRDVANRLVPLIEDQTWFFDTELLVLAQRAGLRIHEVPVDWVDDLDSRVKIVRTALDDLRGITRLAWGRGRRTGRAHPSSEVLSTRDRSAAPSPCTDAGTILQPQPMADHPARNAR